MIANSQKLRFAIFCNGPFVRQWEMDCINAILKLPNAPELALIAVDKEAMKQAEYSKKTFFETVRDVGVSNILYYLYCRRYHHPSSTAQVDISDLFKKTEVVSCETELVDEYSRRFKGNDIETIRSLKLDFILSFAFEIFQGDVLEVSRYGVWSYHHDDEQRYRGWPPCFWEIVCGDPVTGAVLQRQTDRLDAGTILRRGYFPTEMRSYAANLDRVYTEASRWPAQVCVDLMNGNTEYLSAPPTQTSAPLYVSPKNRHMLRFFLRMWWSRKKSWFKLWFRRDTWALGLVEAPIASFLNNDFKPRVTYISHSKPGAYFADPFGVKKNGGISILCEEYDYRIGKGKLTEIVLEKKAREWKHSEVPTDFPLSCHLSYPFLIEHEGQRYCVPEAWHSKEIALFQQSGKTWEKVTTLVPSVAGVDPTILLYEGTWWLFFTDQNRKPDVNLFLWYADDLMGPWKPHPLNPLKSDIRAARPAGTPFIDDGKLYRPAQDCSRTYGGKVSIQEIVKLSRIEFEEKTASVVNPDALGPFPDGLHTLASVGDLTLIDCKRTSFVYSGFMRQLKKRLGFRR